MSETTKFLSERRPRLNWTCVPLLPPPPPRTMSGELPPSINIEEPRWDQSTFTGRANHFFTVTDPRNILLSDAQLEHAGRVVRDYR